MNWVNVNNELPPIGRHVLTYEGGEIPMPIKVNYIHNYNYEWGYGNSENITHWLPLPEGPNDER